MSSFDRPEGEVVLERRFVSITSSMADLRSLKCRRLLATRLFKIDALCRPCC